MVIRQKRVFTFFFIFLSVLFISQQILKSCITVSGSDSGTVVLSNDVVSVSHFGFGFGNVQYPLEQSLVPSSGILCLIKYNNTLLPPMPISNSSGLEIVSPATQTSPLASESVMRTSDQLANVTMTVTLDSSSPSGSIIWNVTNIGTKLLSNVSFFELGVCSDGRHRSFGSYSSGSVDRITLSNSFSVFEVYSSTSSAAHDFSTSSTVSLDVLGRMAKGTLNGLDFFGPADFTWAREWAVGSLSQVKSGA